jgi:hypothetical protein
MLVDAEATRAMLGPTLTKSDVDRGSVRAVEAVV